MMTVLLALSTGTHSGVFWRISATTGTPTAFARCITAVSTDTIRSHCASIAGSWKKFSLALNSSVRSSRRSASRAFTLSTSCGTALTMKQASRHSGWARIVVISSTTRSTGQQRLRVLANGLMNTSLPVRPSKPHSRRRALAPSTKRSGMCTNGMRAAGGTSTPASWLNQPAYTSLMCGALARSATSGGRLASSLRKLNQWTRLDKPSGFFMPATKPSGLISRAKLA